MVEMQSLQPVDKVGLLHVLVHFCHFRHQKQWVNCALGVKETIFSVFVVKFHRDNSFPFFEHLPEHVVLLIQHKHKLKYQFMPVISSLVFQS